MWFGSFSCPSSSSCANSLVTQAPPRLRLNLRSQRVSVALHPHPVTNTSPARELFLRMPPHRSPIPSSSPASASLRRTDSPLCWTQAIF
ncbi:hypothetical protein AALO_G00257070 [Alosa alosa]|uniref:Uncharacterized protein n=1 Tax=Alosa alosa TaxID=278164 RepID=A0AAV6FWD9_9TELE|nr:hypothetical protein AALO_G00257070 [Alosa alosa]